MSVQSQNIQKMVTFSPVLYQMGKHKAQQLGLTFTDYIRYLIVDDVKPSVDRTDMPLMDDETERNVRISLEQYKQGDYTTMKTKKDIDDFINSL